MISIVLPCYNREKIIFYTLNSIKQQSFENWERIIIDDGSTDATFTVVEKFILNDKRFKKRYRTK
ncbi:glycosyltransferase family 2 protein [Lutibacter holmesii]|uniref:Glycosyltransferase family 2 protein n=1 Tax=Lutibacter holmesii TaxID=1137985 RepID=A0ABW3WSM1_9FLAO